MEWIGGKINGQTNGLTRNESADRLMKGWRDWDALLTRETRGTGIPTAAVIAHFMWGVPRAPMATIYGETTTG